MRVAIAGAGIAGLACASRLVDMGFEVQVFDKGRKPGGRLSTKTFERWAWDYGAQYFTVRSRGFAEWVAGRMRDDCIAAWKNGPPHAFVGVPGMASLVEDLCTGRDVSFGVTIQRCERTREGWRLYSPGCVCGSFDAVILAIPAEQAMPLIALQDLDMARPVVAARTLPCWTLMLGFAEPLAGLPDYLRGIEPIAWAARNCSPSAPMAQI